MTHRQPGRAARVLRPARGLALIAALTVAACGGRISNPFSDSGRGSTELRIEVENQTFNDMRLYAQTLRGPQFLGQVGGKNSRTFTIPWPRLDEIRLRMDFLAGESVESNRVDAAPGDRLELIVPPNARGAYLRRR